MKTIELRCFPGMRGNLWIVTHPMLVRKKVERHTEVFLEFDDALFFVIWLVQELKSMSFNMI